ncbi:hypothetical protein E1A91_A08G257600v1 [Gossypium mustelinum]|uniref:DUF4094 domain-containing protein n=1 Tax=Gossypium mustelinum TaxID=34275 RepID=A0A5D2YEK7_GOSMU|nr:hypothetical protein E1A91_A08G257600v1 [Gossypium mustelinum]
MRGKAVSGKAILVLCLASFLAGSLITSRTWTSQSHNNNHPIVNHVTASNKLGEFDHKLRVCYIQLDFICKVTNYTIFKFRDEVRSLFLEDQN